MYPRLGRIWVPCPSPEEGLLVVVNGTLKKEPTESLDKSRCFYLINQEQLSAQMFNVEPRTGTHPNSEGLLVFGADGELILHLQEPRCRKPATCYRQRRKLKCKHLPGRRQLRGTVWVEGGSYGR